ncbi:MAG: helix-turn-helix domain-containing protein [Lachnospiraceae bacterium]|nr:helix-turn-helix domain-containing protein [Lachnospiraceae bacterium]
MGNIHNIGTNIRRMRKAQRITLQQLAESSGLSVGYLSNVERNVTSPTLINLQKICEVLKTSLGDLLERNEREKIVIRKDEREITVDEEKNTRIETLEFGKEFGSCLYMTIEPESNFEGTVWQHECHEVGTIISGEMRVEMEGVSYDLREGDTILVKAHTPHCCYNTSKTEAVVSYWFRIWPSESMEENFSAEEEIE